MQSATVASDEPIVTKLYPAPARRSIIVRARLLDMLRRAAQTPLSLIVAPAGYGKTTLLSSWSSTVAQRGGGCAWLSLDSNDNDAARFWAAMAAAFGRADPAIGAQLRPLLGSLVPPAERFVAVVVNACATRREPLVLALDDFHTIDNPALIDAVALLVERAPPMLRLVVAGRTEPPLPLPRWRVRGLVAEIKAAELRFSADEAARMVMAISGTRLSSEAALALAARTEGWAAALVLAAQGEPGEPDTSGRVQRDLFEYVVAEVLSRQPPRLRHFLLQTSLLERLCAPLCDELTGEPGSHEVLELLERNNLFLVPLDDLGRWYRYHHLFAAALRTQLQRGEAGPIAELHRRAARWFEHHGLLREAIEHALAAADWPHAARLVAAEARPALLRGEIASVTGWLQALPSEQLAGTAELVLIGGWLRVLDGDLAAADEHAQRAQTLAQRRDASHIAELAALAIIVAALRAEPIALDPGATVPAGDPFLRSVLLLGRAFAAFWSGELGVAERGFTDAATAGQQRGSLVAVIALCQRGDVQIKRAALRRAEASYREALALAEPGVVEDAHQSPLSGFVLIGLGLLAAERGEHAVARRRLVHGIALSEHWGAIGTFDGYLALAELYAHSGDTTAATEALASASAISRRLQLTYTEPLLEAAAAELAAQAGRLEPVRMWLDGIAVPAATGTGPLVDEAIALSAARMCIVLERFGDALGRVAAVLPAAEAAGRIRTAIEAHVLAAQAQLGLFERRAARTHLWRALELAAAEGVVAPLRDVAAWDKGLLAELAVAAGPRTMAHALAARLSTHERPNAPRQPDDLSAREKEVLALLAEGLGNAEIAERLIVAHSTVKKHVNHIFAKLGAATRVEAVARARERRLLD